jgi:hypothetical protein
MGHALQLQGVRAADAGQGAVGAQGSEEAAEAGTGPPGVCGSSGTGRGEPVTAAGYAELLDRRAQLDGAAGFEPTWLPDFLFGFQS